MSLDAVVLSVTKSFQYMFYMYFGVVLIVDCLFTMMLTIVKF
jgi:hypothetical protein